MSKRVNDHFFRNLRDKYRQVIRRSIYDDAWKAEVLELSLLYDGWHKAKPSVRTAQRVKELKRLRTVFKIFI